MNAATGIDLTTLRGGEAAVPRPARRWRTRMGVPLGVAAGFVGLMAYAGRDALRPATGVRVVPVVVKPLEGGSGMHGAEAADGAAHPPAGGAVVQAAGWIEPDPFAVNVSALTEGIVREVLVLEGQQVAPGEVVARLIDEDATLGAARAEAALAQARADVARMEAGVELAAAAHAEATAELGALPSEIGAATARAGELRDDLERKRSAPQGVVSQGELTAAGLRVAAQEALVQAVEARRPVLRARVDGRAAERNAAASQVEAARGVLARAEVERREAALRLERTEIKAPTGGVVLNRLVEPGSMVRPMSDLAMGGVVARLYDPARLQMRVDIPLSEAAKVGLAQRAEVTTEGVPGRVFAGRVSRVVHEANVQRNTVQVKVAIEGIGTEGDGLRPEMLARARFFGERNGGTGGSPARGEGGMGQQGGTALADEPPVAPDAPPVSLLAPRAALAESGGGAARAWVVNVAAGAAERREVRLGRGAEGDWVEVTDGLRPGDRVIIDAPASLREGARVRVVEEAHASGGDA